MTQTREVSPALLARVLGGRLGREARPARDLVWDSRAVEPGAAFVALPGARAHGETYAEDALARGAAVVIGPRARDRGLQVDDPYRALLRLGRWLRSGFPGVVAGVSGSVGKTSTKEALARALDWPATEGNLNTPPALARFFWHLEPDRPGAVVELGIDRPGEMDELLELTAPDLGVLTAVAPVHLEGLGRLENVAREKLKLLEASPLRLAHVELRRWELPEGTRTFGFDDAADFAGEALELGCAGTRFRYAGRTLRLGVLGRGAALAALAALAAAELLGRDVREAAERLETLKPTPGRLEPLRAGSTLWLNDSYNASPRALEAALEVLARCPGPRGVVLGTMRELGSEAERWHLEAAERVMAAADRALFVGEFAAAMAAGRPGSTAVTNVEEALDLLPGWARGLSSVLVKGSRALALERLLEVVGA
ncbi:MAG TPA: UDP-N-acetylmuramoyl-tripeptide--D-alanyl-D-alanine ligase [Oceanithermus profundus]|uniref:UDP-N-acetylmuramoyl-tripeptide--D-alanyl-D-alanine ligase n=1 Tax=Oceanithermus profundus TaxID=187137 RepID=A0A7C5WQU0_9DEIN|nr:UDP-N-acetylmuramoyl-tripeptide--D-alanyl-D-alanine ligase [Oceanithermus profundus]